MFSSPNCGALDATRTRHFAIRGKQIAAVRGVQGKLKIAEVLLCWPWPVKVSGSGSGSQQAQEFVAGIDIFLKTPQHLSLIHI